MCHAVDHPTVPACHHAPRPVASFRVSAQSLIIPITDLNDPRLEPYRKVKERELARDGGRFIAEGEHLVRRLMASDFPVESVLLARRRADELAAAVRPDVPVYVVP